MNRQLFYLERLTRVLGLRASLYAIVALAAALLAYEVGPLMPEEVGEIVGDEAAEELLKIMASSMLAVATFSLATMVAAYGSVTNNASPRAAALVLEDRSAQNALSSFIGAFIFSIVGLTAVGTGLYGPQARFVLFVETLAVLALVVVRLLRWIDQLAHLGRIGAAIDRVEEATREALTRRRSFLGGRPDGEAPADAHPLTASTVGYIQHVDVPHLERVAARNDLVVHLALLPGAFIRLSRPVLYVEGSQDRLTEDVRGDLLRAVVVGGSRTIRQDPRFGLVVLAEIGSRALSPGVNDPGTAIDVVGTAVRVLSVWAERHWEEAPQIQYPHVSVPPLSASDCFEDVFAPIARDGAAFVEVGIALQRGLQDLALAKAPGFGQAAREHSRLALKRARRALVLEEEIAALEELAAEVASGAGEAEEAGDRPIRRSRPDESPPANDPAAG